MRKLSDFKGDEAIELWADLLEPVSEIIGDAKVQDALKSGATKMAIAQVILKSHAKEAEEILLRIDPTPLNGLTLVFRLVSILADLGES